MVLSALWLASILFAAPSPPSAAQENLAFASGRLTSWEGQGFAIGPAAGPGPSLHFDVTSGDQGAKGRKAMLYRTIVIPANVSAIVTHAAAVRRRGASPGPTLDIILEAAERRIVPKQRYTADGWQPVDHVQPGTPLHSEEYRWRVDALAGRYVRIALIDDDDRPGCFLACDGFRFVTRDELAAQDFRREIGRLAKKHDLGPVTRADSPHFVAVGTADDSFVERRLDLCEALYSSFFEHFRSHGLPARVPQGKLLLAVFDTQEGFEAALGQQIPGAVTGLYQKTTNRLLVYDVGTNRDLRETRQRTLATAMRMNATDPDRGRIVADFEKRAGAWRQETNVASVLHETAHQLSFNGGLLNREGDVPLWLAEGLACYCEGPGTDWRGPGGPNPERTQPLANQLRANAGFLPLCTLIENDDWFTRQPTKERILLGYAQSWALFRMLMEERAPALERYLATVYERRTPERRLSDFVGWFGDLDKLEARYQVYLREVVAKAAHK